ncbi:MAG: hypothetical protein ACYCV7_02005 [Acidimicrobiales bacterium]
MDRPADRNRKPSRHSTGASSGVPLGGGTRDEQVEWGVPSHREPRWPASLAILLAIILQVVLPDNLTRDLGPRWLLPAAEGLLGVALLLANPWHTAESRVLRPVSIGLITIINLANIVTLGALVSFLLAGSHAGGRALVYASVPIWLTNVIVFGLWYWELDRGGPAARLTLAHPPPDFLFPQQSAPGAAPEWAPTFLDYVYTSFTNATAFSPTDTMPLTAWAKLLMMIQSLASLLTVSLVVSRAVNILN